LVIFRENERYTSGTFADDVIFERKDPNSKPHHDELSVNDPDEYFQGDVDLSEKQAEILSETLQDSNDSARKEKNIEPKTRKKR
uniref:Uncharacterized protein n=1 Tax=Parascaris equorum TaxID=6256 RepID=A0A914R765_PAREQ